MPRIVFVLLLCWPTVVYADYLEVRRAATLRAEPKPSAATGRVGR